MREIHRRWRGKVFQVTSVEWRCWRAVKDPVECENGVPRVPTAIATLDFVALSGSLHAVHGVSKARLVYTTWATKEIRLEVSFEPPFLFHRVSINPFQSAFSLYWNLIKPIVRYAVALLLSNFVLAFRFDAKNLFLEIATRALNRTTRIATRWRSIDRDGFNRRNDW